jgi:hypothetical protein
MPVGLVVLLVVLAVHPLGAQRTPAPPPNPLAAAKVWQCAFTNYGVARWDGTSARVEGGQDDLRFRVEGYDSRRGIARIVAGGSVDVAARLTETGLHLIEQTSGGNFTLTSIFIGGASADIFYAVHSRHLGDEATPPSVSQFYGTCEVAQ